MPLSAIPASISNFFDPSAHVRLDIREVNLGGMLRLGIQDGGAQVERRHVGALQGAMADGVLHAFAEPARATGTKNTIDITGFLVGFAVGAAFIVLGKIVVMAFAVVCLFCAAYVVTQAIIPRAG